MAKKKKEETTGKKDTKKKSTKDLNEKIDMMETELAESKDKYLRLFAEFDNYKKRTTRETEELVKYANENLIKELLNIVDNLERAIESAAPADDTDDPLKQGIQLTLSEVVKLL